MSCRLGNTHIVSLQLDSDPELVGVEVCVLEHFFEGLLVLQGGQRQGSAADATMDIQRGSSFAGVGKTGELTRLCRQS